MEKKKKSKKGLIITLVVIAALILSFVLVCTLKKEEVEPASGYQNTNPYITEDYALVAAHRSGGEIYPENTLFAFKSCCESDDFETDIFEFDLHLTKDNILILLHDKNFDRTSNSEEYFGKKGVKPEEKTYEELRAGLNLGENYQTADGSYPYRGLRGDEIPDDLRVVRLEDVLDYLISQDKEYHYIIEIKDGGEIGKTATDELYRIISEKGILQNVIAGTFKGDITKYFDEKYDDMIRSAGISEVAKFYFASITGAKLNQENIKFDVLQIPYKQFVINLGTQDMINRAHKYNIAVQYWTINDEEEIKELNDRKADAIITDNPKRAYEIIHGENK